MAVAILSGPARRVTSLRVDGTVVEVVDVDVVVVVVDPVDAQTAVTVKGAAASLARHAVTGPFPNKAGAPEMSGSESRSCSAPEPGAMTPPPVASLPAGQVASTLLTLTLVSGASPDWLAQMTALNSV